MEKSYKKTIERTDDLENGLNALAEAGLIRDWKFEDGAITIVFEADAPIIFQPSE